MRAGYAAASLTVLLFLVACDGREESAIDNLANGANATAVDNSFRAEAQAVLEPLAPPAPGTPGGLPVESGPVAEGAIDPDSAQGAAQVVQGYYSLLEAKDFDDAQDLWGDRSAIGSQDDAHFAARFRGFSEIHAHVGTPGATDGAAGSMFVTVPVQVYGRIAANGKPWYALRQVVLRRVNDVPGSDEADRRWHIASIGPYAPPSQKDGDQEPGNAAERAQTISATDGLVRKSLP